MKLLKWGPSRVRVKSAKAPLTSYVEDPRAQDLYATHDAALTPPPYELRHVTASTLL